MQSHPLASAPCPGHLRVRDFKGPLEKIHKDSKARWDSQTDVRIVGSCEEQRGPGGHAAMRTAGGRAQQHVLHAGVQLDLGAQSCVCPSVSCILTAPPPQPVCAGVHWN